MSKGKGRAPRRTYKKRPDAMHLKIGGKPLGDHPSEQGRSVKRGLSGVGMPGGCAQANVR
ncbi:MAG: hypothetical protein Q8L41_04165 [Anaerolineales bacterium]|nr:hypothetical protein [Anaerolineales bacterium]